ncbi:hypothetical protein BO94DRAFT_625978 [Aspergillus sclerotioniger CBS 115572]|uniref:Heterokaryon incompatibility domain-containing protein n=1 Tax=Aspergillus sclerotioniger CBS 115572 TaxID=1450535 RepID=A0A317W4G3_9EURO|nr:hypothetical protein BO94DRAFT_625978 [Aspergillus sclerotioniger CBS 115572]PWY80879.1 hypothetical protein BO94DRAFT_625978 [Aspergillus sclerotioniger CBS 115572]
MIFEAADVLICGPDSTYRNITPPIADERQGIIFNGFAQERCDYLTLSSGSAPDSFQIRSTSSWNKLAWLDVRYLYVTLWYAELQCPWGEKEDSVSSRENSPSSISNPASHHSPDPISSTDPMVIVDPDSPPSLTSSMSTDRPADELPELPPGVGSSEFTEIESRFAPIKEWLGQCEGSIDHAECAALPFQWRSIPKTAFRLIDIDRRCVVDAPEHCSYIAVGYVLKGEDNIQLNKQTSATLMRPGGLDALIFRVASVVQDGITVCQALKERYLWADSLCIMHDAPRDTKFHSLRMNLIYAGAKVLLAAVSAKTASQRLLQESSVGPHALSTVDSAESLEALLTVSPWMRRAWSYQEMVFSHRAILFTSQGIFMQCQEGTYNTTGTLITSRGNKKAQVSTVGGVLCNRSHGLDSYLSAVEDYSQRDFTKDMVRRDAFRAISRGYQGLVGNQPWTIWYGLPLYAFDQTICWRTDRHHPHLRNTEFPSWSWLGWNDRVSFDRTLTGRVHTCQMVEFPHWHRPCQYPRKPIHRNHQHEFGFPTSCRGVFWERPCLHVYVSCARMRIGDFFTESDGTNGLYPVFRRKAAPDEGPVSSTDVMEGLVLSRDLGDGDTARREVHDAGRSITPLAHIWLDRGWREKHHKDWILHFVALTGERGSDEDKWIITMLMAVEQLREDGDLVGWERVQVIDCRIHEDEWKLLGGTGVPMQLF